MSTINISLPEEMKKYVDKRVVAGHYSTASEFFRDLVRQDQERIQEMKRDLEKKLLEGLNSPDAGEWTAKDFAAMKEKLRQRFGKKAG